MPKVTMLRSQKGSDNGITVKMYEKGETYVVGDALAEVFVNDLKVAEALPMRTSEPREERDAKGPREDKDAASAKKESRRG